MIDIPTVIVLGAGASKELGYPLASDIKRYLATDFSRDGNVDDTLIQKALEKWQLSRTEGWEIAKQIIDSTYSSVDEFVQNIIENQLGESQKFEQAARVLASYQVIKAEYDFYLPWKADRDLPSDGKLRWILPPNERRAPPGSQVNPSKHWYVQHLLPALGSISTLPCNKLSIVSFNYDSSCEAMLLYYLLVNNPKDVSGRIYDYFRDTFKIVHPHGSLLTGWSVEGRLATISEEAIDRLYHELHKVRIERNSDYLQTLASRVIAAATHFDGEDEHYRRASNLIDAAERVYILGFGYHPKLLAKIGLSVDRLRGKELIGSVYGERDITCAEEYLPGIVTFRTIAQALVERPLAGGCG